ncbi:hypothetical protein AB4144_17075, partial [Rhizobiaceae sp. 2RAB30]
MPLHSLTDAELRAHCKAAIETLEQWLRAIIDAQLREHYGEQYLEAKRKDGSHLFNSKIRATLTE